MKKIKRTITQIDRGELPPIVIMQTNEPVHDRIFYWAGIPYIIGAQSFNGELFDVEMMSIAGITEMHVHKFYHGVCYLCGFCRDIQEVMDLT